MNDNKWDKAYSNTKVIKVSLDTWRNCCKECDKPTEVEPTRERQQLGNVIENIVSCMVCQKTFVSERAFNQLT